MKRFALITMVITVFWAALSGSPANDHVTAAASAPIFKDIKGHWAEKTIGDMVKQGILDGYPDGTFRPQEPVKVDQFIKMLVLSYTDLHQNGSRSWNSQFLQSLTEENQAILKQDYRYFDFKPSSAGYWAKLYIDVASDLHFLNKSRYNDFQADMTRENVAEIIYYTLQETEFLEDGLFGQKMAQAYGDLMGASEREQKFIAETLVKGIMQGYPNGFFGVGDKVTRAESLVILNRLTDKSKRLAIKVSPEKLERIVPTVGGGKKIIVFPDKRMWDAYESLLLAGQLRGSNHDLYETTLRLFKDQAEKDSVLNRTSGSSSINEEAAVWLDPQYNTYGITVRLRDGTLARNKEVVEQFTNQLFGYNASAFKELFNDICKRVEAGAKVASQQKLIGTDNVNIQVDTAAKTVIFSIATKK
ncbi:S-layer homology domain-containing protein [Paenibacillus sp. LHD-38]|uniref:S-layer homology domain-containing protein n=1 Tax=Paenibacillus sp. LHD-38 TaxID=3072143 RepID=UPI00280E1F9E|nr:S-layer homology domain-containing protein [Paenibacillus sp. LHD-38]MDQ8734906.1 S-layer homology domain-containing protein [Paenibacillus sp. LHD-38]